LLSARKIVPGMRAHRFHVSNGFLFNHGISPGLAFRRVLLPLIDFTTRWDRRAWICMSTYSKYWLCTNALIWLPTSTASASGSMQTET
jgi:hypothetical protein